jgi:hypothetical protein
MSIFSLIKRVATPITKIINKSVKDKDLALQLNHEIEAALSESLDKELEAQRDIIVAEAKGESWLQRSWRPVTMLSFLVLLFVYWFGLAPDYVVENPTVVDSVFDLLKIGIGGYIVGRSAEKGLKIYKTGESS